jgi:hypothetical protein
MTNKWKWPLCHFPKIESSHFVFLSVTLLFEYSILKTKVTSIVFFYWFEFWIFSTISRRCSLERSFPSQQNKSLTLKQLNQQLIVNFRSSNIRMELAWMHRVAARKVRPWPANVSDLEDFRWINFEVLFVIDRQYEALCGFCLCYCASIWIRFFEYRLGLRLSLSLRVGFLLFGNETHYQTINNWDYS